jgi:eukaryotic-like serine/threonine-protein kinase
VVKNCVQPAEAGALDATITAIPGERSRSSSGGIGRSAPRGEDPVAIQIGLRRALTIGCAMWSSFFTIDVAVVRYMNAGALSYFAALRVAVLVIMLAVLLRLYRKVIPSELALRACDVLAYTSAAIGVALMCIEFRGFASPYVPGVCLVLLGRSVTSQDPWRRGLVMTGIPVASFFAVLFGAAAFSPHIAAQVHDPAAVTTLLINSAYVLSTCVLLVMCGHIVWSLRRQVFEARSLGRYRLKRRLAAGGMGDVWVAYHPGLKRDVAVKILRPETQERSARALERFEREVHSTAELVHPNTVRVFDYGTTEDGLWYYVMELLEGETLAAHVARLGPLSPARAVHIVGQAARALGEAHERGIVHRDVKPENLFLTSLGGEHDFVKVLDFGIAKIRSSDGNMTDTGCVLGTPAYISPEVAVGQEADSRSDVYGLGGVLYYLLCGRPPFEADTAGALIFAHVHERPASPSSLLGRPIPADVENVVMRALEKDPALRFATSAELALALSSCGLAGTWTFGDATGLARRSSRPPASGVMEALPSLAAPAVPSEWADGLPDPPPLVTPKTA